MYNVRVKDFGNGRKQYTVYDYVIESSKSELQKIDDDIAFYKQLLDVTETDCKRKLLVKKICDLEDKRESIRPPLPCEMTDEEYNQWLKDKENAKINYQIGNDRRAKNSIWDYSRSNEWHYFLTFTFSPDKVNRFDYDDCKKKITKWLDNMNQRFCDGNLKYLIVPEQHKNGAWHFHGLLADVGLMQFQDSGKRDCKGRIIYNLPQFKLGFTTATAVTDTNKVALYITKYVTKSVCCSLNGKHRFLKSKNLNKPVETYYLSTKYEPFYIDDSLIEWKQSKEFEILGQKRSMNIIEVNENLEDD